MSVHNVANFSPASLRAGTFAGPSAAPGLICGFSSFIIRIRGEAEPKQFNSQLSVRHDVMNGTTVEPQFTFTRGLVLPTVPATSARLLPYARATHT